VIPGKSLMNQAGNVPSFFSAHRAGSLFAVLGIFADAGINLTRIESMPNREDPGNYYFFLDFEGNINDTKIKTALDEVIKNTVMYKFSVLQGG